jgi:hypothetical protein
MENNTLDVIFNIIGASGVVMILLAYFLMQLDKITSKTLTYSLLNLSGSCLVMVSLLHRWNLPSVIIEISWITISAFGVYKAIKNKREQNNVAV